MTQGDFETLPDEAPPPAPQSFQELSTGLLHRGWEPTQPTDGRTVMVHTNDPRETALEWAREIMEGRAASESPAWVRLYRADHSGGLFALLHQFCAPAEMEIIVAGTPGMLSRTSLRFLSRWAFITLGLRRVVARIPSDKLLLSAYALRAGFKFEGVSRGFYADGSDASVWAMTKAECPWLPGAARGPVKPAELTLPLAEQVH